MLACITSERYEWSAAQQHQGNGGPYYGFHTYITGTEGTLLVFGEGGGGAIEGVQPAPVILCALVCSSPFLHVLQLPLYAYNAGTRMV